MLQKLTFLIFLVGNEKAVLNSAKYKYNFTRFISMPGKNERNKNEIQPYKKRTILFVFH